jgi:glycosyltransferase involved in cell wall biosynthesis
MPTVSIVICTRNRASHLRQTLAHIARHPKPTGLDADLWVIDNGSTDATEAVVSQAAPAFAFPLHYTREETPGLSYARNTALRVSGGQILLFTDDDVRVPVNWIADMTRPIRTGEFDAVAGGVRLAPHLRRAWMEPWHRAFLASTDAKPRPPQTMIGANMCFARRVLQVVPGFDTEIGVGRLGLSGETHFAERLVHAGFRIADALDVEVEHHFDPSRLRRASFLSSARRLGRTMAHLHHHWRHHDEPFSHSAARSRAAIVAMQLKLAAKRLLNLRDVLRTEGCAGWENYYVREIAYLKQSLIERKRSRRYPKLGSRPYDDANLPTVPSTVARAGA